MINIFIIAYDNKNVVVRQEEQFFFPSDKQTSCKPSSRISPRSTTPHHDLNIYLLFIYYLYFASVKNARRTRLGGSLLALWPPCGGFLQCVAGGANIGMGPALQPQHREDGED